MSERLRDLFDAENPAVVELARLVRAATEIDPKPGAQERVRAKLSERRPARLRWHQPVVVLLVLVIVTPALVAGVRRLVPGPAAPALTPPREPTLPATPPGRRAAAAPDELRAPAPPPATELADPRDEEPPAAAATPAPASTIAAPPIARPPAATSRRARPPTPPPTEAIAAPTEALAAPTEAIAAPTEAIAAPTEAIVPLTPATSRDPASSIAVAATRSIDPAPTPEDPRARASVGRSMTGLRGTRLSRAPLAEGALVLRALNLLRHDHDPRAALRELDGYRTRFPQGDLGEEVLALTIEARAALDDRSARPLAEQYLQQFPRGRFAEMAERAVRRFR
jgi:hypothetical protein